MSIYVHSAELLQGATL